MNFSGCGVITDWTIVGFGASGDGNISRMIELQLFRPDPASSNVFTKVTSSVVATQVNRQVKVTRTFKSIGFTFSSGDVLGFHYTNDAGILRVSNTISFSTHFVLTAASTSTANVVTATAPAGASSLYVPRMSVSVICMECPRSTTILPSVTTSATPLLTDIPSSMSCTECPRSTLILPTSSEPVEPSSSLNLTSPTSSSTAMPTSSTAAAIGGAVGAVVVLAVVGVIFLIVVGAVCVVRKRRQNTVNKPSHTTFSDGDVDAYYNINLTITNPAQVGSSHTVYTTLSQPTTKQEVVYTELNSSTTYTSLDPQTTHKDGECTHLITKETPLDPSTTHQESVHTPGGDYTALDPQTTQKEGVYTHVGVGAEYSTLDPATTHKQDVYTPLNRANPLDQDTYINVVNNEEADMYEPVVHPREQMMSTLSDCKIPSKSLTLGTQVHSGTHTAVYIANMNKPSGLRQEVVVKLVKEGAPEEESLRMLEEAAILRELNNQHVLTLVGIVDTSNRVMMVTEYLSNGSLEKYLYHLRTNPSQLSSPDLPSLLLQFCKQVADGLACLSRKSFVHRDIAARNILLDKDLNCKISDFGMTKVIEEDNYYTLKKGTKIPVKWTSPEALLYKKYSTRSDVWSYGMLMYEIWSLGHKPFEDKTVQER